MYLHGGFDNESPTVPTDAIMKLDSIQLLKSAPNLVEKIENFIGIQHPRTPPSPGTPGSLSPNEP